MRFGLTDQTIEKLQEVFRHFPVVEKVVIYGSRAKGTWKKGSDIDLTLFGRDLDWRQCSVIAEALDDLLLPNMIDLSVMISSIMQNSRSILIEWARFFMKRADGLVHEKHERHEN